jgi:pyruvate dehydrogenase E2 component (dihydrolipoamide acetyltransferase)
MPSLNDLLIRAVAIALADEPRMNCRVHDDAIEYPADVNIGIAVGLEEGLVVPVLARAQARSLAEIAAESKRIIGLARDGKLVGAGQGTFTVSNLGMFGVKSFTAVINPPEGAILAVGAATDRAVPAGGGFLPRKIMEVTVSADHRAIDGLLAARFLLRLRRLLEEPSRIF